MDDVTKDDKETRYAALVDRLKADRLARRMSWDKYAKLLDVPISTLAKMARGQTKRPHDTTIAWLEQQLDKLQAQPAN
ncbi:MAG: hypothetical protein AB7P11_21170 [Hydrogenophaga sp.]|uniref:hypothetical protein n=1 Tax=Hydrogenophaga sp. TaxID=1904254 RepID=UPI003D0ADD1D